MQPQPVALPAVVRQRRAIELANPVKSINPEKPIALLSVTDKSGIIDFGKGLVERGFQLVSTGGTAKSCRDAGLPVTEVSELTGCHEMLDGRVKTLHPIIHGGILGDTRLESHRLALGEARISPIELVAVNLYAFEETISKDHTFAEAIESIDIGGPAMIRSAAKNNANVTVVVDPNDYSAILEAIDRKSLREMRLKLATKAFRHTAFYDATIAHYLGVSQNENPLDAELFTIGWKKVQAFRYGENPHQEGALYRDPLSKYSEQIGLSDSKQLWGKELSFNNISDSESAWELVSDLAKNSCVIVKHGNPCGAASEGSLAESFRSARKSDPISAFGGIAAFNGPVDLEVAKAMTEKGNFLEVVIATDFSDHAVTIFKERSGWGQDVRLIKASLPSAKPYLTMKTIRGGAILQTSDEEPIGINKWSVVTEIHPTKDQMLALKFAWTCVKHIKSNAIAVCSPTRLLGVGAGQMNRVQSVRLALSQASEDGMGAALASDAFFPFPDSIETAASAGIGAIIQPGGSKKDSEVIAKADDLGIAMVFTGFRHFRH